jgi:hypothetical protein
MKEESGVSVVLGTLFISWQQVLALPPRCSQLGDA